MYKKVYLEITNNCNLNCSFCIKNKRKPKFMSYDEFKNILSKLENQTKYLYFHILGEPLLHPKINEFINYASNKFKINITTNGYLIDRVKNNKNIRQINISLHSFNESYGVSLDDYMNNIFNVIDILKENTYISLRFWLKNKFSQKMIDMINERYKVKLDINNIKNNTTIIKNVFISTNEEFIWPDLNNNYYSETGTCYALKDHIGILVDGTIVPCCLDSLGIINLGNIFENTIDEIKNTVIYKKMLEGFKNNKKCEMLCRKCKF